MSLHFHHKPHIKIEALRVLQCIANDQTPLKLRDGFHQKYGIPLQVLDPLFLPIDSIYCLIRSNLEEHLERITFYFECQDLLNSNTIGELLLTYLFEKDEKTYIDFFYSLSDSEKQIEILKVMSSLREEGFATEIELIEYVFTAPLESSYKYKILYVFHQFEQYLKELLSIYDQTIKALMPYLDQMTKTMRSSYEMLEKELNSRTNTFLKENCLMTLSEEENCQVYPYFFCSNSFTLTGTDKGPIYLFFGHNFLTLSNLVESYHCQEDLLIQFAKALGDKSKFDILKSIKEERLYASQLAEKLQISNATVSHHMSALTQLELVGFEKENNKLYYSFNASKFESYLNSLHTLFITH